MPGRKGRNEGSESSDRTTASKSDSGIGTSAAGESQVSDIAESMKKTSLVSNPVVIPEDSNPAVIAEKVAPGIRGVANVKVKTNLFGIEAPRNTPSFRYDIRVTLQFPGHHSKELTKQTREDYLSADRKRKVQKIFVHFVKNNQKFFNCDEIVSKGGSKPRSAIYSLVSDRAAILYSMTLLDFKQEASKTWEFLPSDFDDDLRQELDEAVEKVTIVLKPVDEDFSVALDDFKDAICPNLDQQNRSIQQFYELATSQVAFFDGNHVTYGNNLNFFLNPDKFGYYSRNDCPELGGGKYLAVGSDKSVRFVEGPGGYSGPGKAKNVHMALVLDSKKAAFHAVQQVQLKVFDILNKSKHINCSLEPKEIKMLKNQLKDLFVTTEHGRKKTFQIAGLSRNDANKTVFKDDSGRQISVTDYFLKAYNIKLQFTRLPLLCERVARTQEYNLYPMEVCTIEDNQRVSQAKQTPQQMERMIKLCATPPFTRQEEIRRNMAALKLDKTHLTPKQMTENANKNEWLANMQIRLRPNALSFDHTRQLPPGTARYAERQVKIDMNQGNWKSVKEKYFMAAHCHKWTMIQLGVDSKESRLFTEFKNAFVSYCRQKGMKMVEPDGLCYVEPTEKALESAINLAARNGSQFFFCVQSNRSFLHNTLKLLETKYQIVTQDLKITTAANAPRKIQTLENIVNKTNMKLGGLNYNLLLENEKANQWIRDSNRLFIGLSVCPQPSLTAQEKARGMLQRSPIIIGYSANTNPNPFEFVGGAFYQENREQNESLLFYNIVHNLIGNFKKSRRTLPNHLVIYRDGISCGQYSTVIKKEMPAIRKAFEGYGAKYEPKLTVISCSKSHNIRLFKADASSKDKPADQNIPCGTVMDQFITHPIYTQFYLNAHRAFQGTVKTPLYTIISDDAKMSSDEAQGLSYALCCGHQIVSLTISIPVPLYMAQSWRDRGKRNYQEYSNDDSNDSAVEAGDQANNWGDLNRVLGYGEHLAALRVNA